jgi:hypothetical protein
MYYIFNYSGYISASSSVNADDAETYPVILSNVSKSKLTGNNYFFSFYFIYLFIFYVMFVTGVSGGFPFCLRTNIIACFQYLKFLIGNDSIGTTYFIGSFFRFYVFVFLLLLLYLFYRY